MYIYSSTINIHSWTLGYSSDYSGVNATVEGIYPFQLSLGTAKHQPRISVQQWIPAYAGMTLVGSLRQPPKSSTTLKPSPPATQHKRPITINTKTHHKKIHLPTSGLHPPAGYKTHKAAQVGLSWIASQTMGRAERQATEWTPHL